MNALEIRDLRKTYPGFTLEGLNLTLPQGCVMGLVGENGAGKSTTLKLILNQISRDGGEITILGKDNRENTSLIKEEIGVVMDEVGIPRCLTAPQVGKVMGHVFRTWDQGEYHRLLKGLSLPPEKRFEEYSQGMKRKLGIAVALAHHPKLLILDEATNGLDPVIREEVVEMFGEFTRDEGHAVLISSHIVSDLEKICDYIAFLHQGRLLLCQEKDRLYEDYGVLRCTGEQLRSLPPQAVLGKKETPYGVEAIVRREAVAPGLLLGAVDLERLFITMVKEAR